MDNTSLFLVKLLESSTLSSFLNRQNIASSSGEGASTHHDLLVCALWHEVTKAHPLVRVIVMMKCLLMMKLCNKNLNYAKICTNQQKKLKKIK